MAGTSALSTLYSSVPAPELANGSSVGEAFSLSKYGQMTPEKADAASKDFESMFISQMMEQMFGDSEGDDAFGDAETNDVYKGLLMDQYGKLISRTGGIGIASYVKQELLKEQEVHHDNTKQPKSS